MITGKRKLCYTEASDFTDIQGVGNDPIYKRYDSVFAVVKQYIDKAYWSFLAEPEYSIEDDQVYWYVEEWTDDSCPIRLNDLQGDKRQLCEQILSDTVAHYNSIANNLKGDNQKILKSAIKFINKDFVYLTGNHVVLAIWGMKPDAFQYVAGGTIIHEVDFSQSHQIVFDAGIYGMLVNRLDGKVRRKEGTVLSSMDLPEVKAKEGYEFIEWFPSPIGMEVNTDLIFTAKYNKVEIAPTRLYHVSFVANDLCMLDGTLEYEVVPGTILEDYLIPHVIPNVGVTFTGWIPETHAPINDDVQFHAQCIENVPVICHVIFVGDELSSLEGETEIDVPKGTILTRSQIPEVIPIDGAKFKRWSEEIYAPIWEDKTFRAVCEEMEPKTIDIKFNAGDHGVLKGISDYTLPIGTYLLDSQIPSVKAKYGYKFKGWDQPPLETALNGDTTFNALYEKEVPWWKRFWIWLVNGGCLKRLLWFLFILLLLLLLFFALDNCHGCTSHALDADDVINGPAVIDTLDNRFEANPGSAPGGRIEDIPSTPVDEPELGEGIDPGNGDNDYHVGVIEQDPSVTPIENPDDPSGPQIMPNVINVFFKKDNANLNAFAKDFRDIYPDTQKYLLDYDDYVKRISIVMPPEERMEVKQNVEKIMGKKYDFIIVDEFAIQQNHKDVFAYGTVTGGDETNAGWHLLAVHAPQAWRITPGNVNVTVAVVDDGFDTSHEMFKGKIVAPYNIYSKSAKLTNGSGHGTHTAGLAVGLVRDDGKAAGMAPMCRLMPVQVFNGNQSTLSAEISGIAYAIHMGADVVNISMGSSYAGYRSKSENDQIAISKQRGKNEEQLWRRIFQMAKDKNVILVFAAGNDNVVSYLNPQNRPDSIISVTAIDRQFNQSFFDSNSQSGSDYGMGSTIAAPGSEIYSSIPVNRYGMMQGTSMAAPIVAGICALLKSERKEITAGKAIHILQESGKRLSNNKLGPLVQADRALILLKTGQLPHDDEVNNNYNNASSDVGHNDGNEGGSTDTDYSDIFRQIAEHQKAIVDLIEQLPEEERKKVER